MSIENILEIDDLSIYYGSKKAIKNISLKVERNKVLAIIGPSGCGKSTLLRSINRMNDFIDDYRIAGSIEYRGKNILDTSPIELRSNIGMVFQRPNPFPKSIYKNITWAPKIHEFNCDYDNLVEDCLKKAALWDEVKDRLHESALALSGGQQQRLCIARTIAMMPDIILMDEPCSALDPRSTIRIENLINELKKDYTIIIVTHNMQQAARISDKTAFLYEGSLIEYDNTNTIFNNPKHVKTQDYIMGRFG